MPTFARLDPLTSAVTAILELEHADVDALAANKRALLRPLVIDAPPTPTETEVVIAAGYIVEPTRVRRAWVVRPKTAAEIAAAVDAAELAQLKQVIDALQTDIADGITPAPTTAAQAFVAVQDLKRRALRADRILRWLLQRS